MRVGIVLLSLNQKAMRASVKGIIGNCSLKAGDGFVESADFTKVYAKIALHCQRSLLALARRSLSAGFVRTKRGLGMPSRNVQRFARNVVR